MYDVVKKLMQQIKITSTCRRRVQKVKGRVKTDTVHYSTCLWIKDLSWDRVCLYNYLPIEYTFNWWID